MTRIIAGVEPTTQGGVHLARGRSVAYLAQEARFEGTRTLRQEMDAALAHLTAAFLLGWFGLYVAVMWLGRPLYSIAQIVVTGIVIAVGGYLVGPMIMGTYLFVSMNWFGRHAGEFSALRCEDHRSWLRLHVAPSGDLCIHALGIDVVPRRWKEATPTSVAPSLLVPDDIRATAPRSVDYIEVRGAR